MGWATNDRNGPTRHSKQQCKLSAESLFRKACYYDSSLQFHIEPIYHQTVTIKNMNMVLWCITKMLSSMSCNYVPLSNILPSLCQNHNALVRDWPNWQKILSWQPRAGPEPENVAITLVGKKSSITNHLCKSKPKVSTYNHVLRVELRGH